LCDITQCNGNNHTTHPKNAIDWVSINNTSQQSVSLVIYGWVVFHLYCSSSHSLYTHCKVNNRWTWKFLEWLIFPSFNICMVRLILQYFQFLVMNSIYVVRFWSNNIIIVIFYPIYVTIVYALVFEYGCAPFVYDIVFDYEWVNIVHLENLSYRIFLGYCVCMLVLLYVSNTLYNPRHGLSSYYNIVFAQ